MLTKKSASGVRQILKGIWGLKKCFWYVILQNQFLFLILFPYR